MRELSKHLAILKWQQEPRHLTLDPSVRASEELIVHREQCKLDVIFGSVSFFLVTLCEGELMFEVHIWNCVGSSTLSSILLSRKGDLITAVNSTQFSRPAKAKQTSKFLMFNDIWRSNENECCLLLIASHWLSSFEIDLFEMPNKSKHSVEIQGCYYL